MKDLNNAADKIAVCANCHNPYNAEDKYCRYCGAPMGTPVYIDDDFACIYGPELLTRIHKCQKCGYTWKRTLMQDREAFCPRCGGSASVSLDPDSIPPVF